MAQKTLFPPLVADIMQDKFLLFTDTYQKQIYQMDIQSGAFLAVPLSGHDNPIGVDFDHVENKANIHFQHCISPTEIERICLTKHQFTVVCLFLEQIYWTDVADKVIRRAYLNGSHEEDVIALSQSILASICPHQYNHSGDDCSSDICGSVSDAIPDGLALDSIARLVFYTDTGRKQIAVATMTGRYQKVLINRHLDQPRALVLDTARGYA